MRRFAGFAILLMAVAMPLAAPPYARAEDAGAADCNPVPDLIFNAAEPILREVAPGTARLHFVKDGSAQPGCPNAGQACAAPLFVIPGDPLVVTGTRGDFACATFTGPAPKTISTSGWLPRAALVIAAPAAGGAQAGAVGDWLGDWRSGPEQHIRITRTPDDRITLDGEATWGGRDPDRVKRGAVNTGDFVATVAIAGGHLAFLVGDQGTPLPYDQQRAKDESLCGLKFWRLGPYLVVADNLQCGGNNVTFTGIYRRTGKPS
jgi:hypothetical protein